VWGERGRERKRERERVGERGREKKFFLFRALSFSGVINVATSFQGLPGIKIAVGSGGRKAAVRGLRFR
jgi:hypothetical protein